VRGPAPPSPRRSPVPRPERRPVLAAGSPAMGRAHGRPPGQDLRF